MAVYNFIDVSSWQGKIDWVKVKKAGIVGAIIRYADGDTLDSRFNENMKNAIAAGLHVGCYIFSRAKTKAAAESEATRLYNAAKAYKTDMPLYIDLEADGLEKTADTVAAAYLNKMKALGGWGGVYANLNWWNKYLKNTAKNYTASPFWIAQYYSKMQYKPASYMGMWQYTSSGKVDGISGRVDMDKCYVAYWEKSQIRYTGKGLCPAPKRTIDELAHEVIDGLWGSGDSRKTALTEAGHDYEAVQKRVNELLNPEKKSYSGEYPSMSLVKTNAQVIADAIKFANWIVNDNRFGYGRKGGAKYKDTKEYSITHSGGCHFCGSNAHKINDAKKAGLKNPEEWEYTYVCNTIVHACYAHAGVMPMLNARGHAWWVSSYRKSKNWTEISKPSKVSGLKAGDVLFTEGHCMLYIGDNKIAEATSQGNATAGSDAWKKSIHIDSYTASRFNKVTNVFRYTGSVNSTALIKYGEISDRVALLQKYLKWYGADITADRIFGDATLNAVQKLQKEQNLTVDGIVGKDTIAAMKKVVK